MKNFLRALRYAWNYRACLLMSLVCALLAALFWGLAFTSIQPVLHILSKRTNLESFLNEKIAEQDKIINEKNKQIQPLQNQVDELSRKEWNPEVAAERDKIKRNLTNDLAKLEWRREKALACQYWLLLCKKYTVQYLPSDTFLSLAWLFGMVVLVTALRNVFEFGQEVLVGWVVYRSLYDMRNSFFRNVLHLDVEQFNDQGTSEMMARFTNDMETIGTGMRTLFGRVVGEPLKALSCVVFACWINWRLTLMFLVVVPIAFFMLTKVGYMMKRATRRLLERMSRIYKILQETFVGIKMVKAFTMEPRERRRFKAATRDYYRKGILVVNLEALASAGIELLGVTSVAAAFLAGAYLVLKGHESNWILGDQPLDSESLLELYGFLVAIADPVRKLSSVYTRMQSGFAEADRVFAFMDRQPRIHSNSQGPRLERVRLGIEFRDICFSYEPGQPILTNVRLHVRAGETVALVGKNGCGKTTLVSLLPRFYDPDHGSILIDGVDIRRLNLRRLRRQIGVVTQDSILFEDTIFNNIAYGCRRASQEKVEAAAAKAHAHDFIMSLPHGYQTPLGEAGSKLSGGQRQRIALARAILRDPCILILDEFTSQSDSEAEADIHRALREFKRDRITFVITHRLHTLEIADRIVVMDGKCIVAAGTHAELLATCPAYQRLHEAHSQRLLSA